MMTPNIPQNKKKQTFPKKLGIYIYIFKRIPNTNKITVWHLLRTSKNVNSHIGIRSHESKSLAREFVCTSPLDTRMFHLEGLLVLGRWWNPWPYFYGDVAFFSPPKQNKIPKRTAHLQKMYIELIAGVISDYLFSLSLYRAYLLYVCVILCDFACVWVQWRPKKKQESRHVSRPLLILDRKIYIFDIYL